MLHYRRHVILSAPRPLFPCHRCVDHLQLDPFEADFYQALYTQSRARFGAYVNSGTVLQNYAHLFDLLTRLRQAVDHPYLILYGNSAMNAANAAAAADGDDVMDGAGADGADGAQNQLQDVCGICREVAEDPVLTSCRHVFCRMCMRSFLESSGHANASTSNAAHPTLRDATNDDAAYIGGIDYDDEVLTDGDGAGAGAGSSSGKKGKSKGGKGHKHASASSAGAGAGATDEDADGPPPTCPTCLAVLTVDLSAAPISINGSSGSGAGGNSASLAAKRKSILARIPGERVGSAFRSSTKIEALLEDIWRCVGYDGLSLACV